jgi:DNA-binding MarR family transcriptional regulator
MNDFNVGAAVRETYRYFSQTMQEKLAPYDIPLGMFYFFCVLWQQDGQSQRELSDRVGTVEAATVEQLRKMEARGFITRRASIVDRRKMHVFLTPTGRALRREVMALAAEVNASALESLNNGEIGFIRLALIQIRKNLVANGSKASRGAVNRTMEAVPKPPRRAAR